MRTRMYGGVEAGGEKPPAIRLATRFISELNSYYSLFEVGIGS